MTRGARIGFALGAAAVLLAPLANLAGSAPRSTGHAACASHQAAAAQGSCEMRCCTGPAAAEPGCDGSCAAPVAAGSAPFIHCAGCGGGQATERAFVQVGPHLLSVVRAPAATPAVRPVVIRSPVAASFAILPPEPPPPRPVLA